ncbi:MAG: 4-alpha-glucanotransferase [Clostridiales bacterium]|nr:4-alpha-glucanotransferase [Candidatus Crickella equi]
MYLYHNSWLEEYRNPFGAATIGSVCRIAIDVYDAQDTTVTLRAWRDGYGESLIPMKRDESFGGEAERYYVDIKMPDEAGLIWYFFIAECGDERVYYGNNEDRVGGEGVQYDHEPDSYQITVYKPAKTPEWFKNGICYQIFPDRFNRDDKWEERTQAAINCRNSRIVGHEGSQRQFIEKDWDKPAYYVKDDEGNVTDWPFYGGSLRGIMEKLDYFKSYGVTTLYLNPIFEAVSNHRYDTADYMKIDPILGSEEDFRLLCKAAGDRGISIILDGVFSHTGADSVYFDKYLNYGGNGAYTNANSKYHYWYNFDSNEPNGYKSWWGVRDLPEVKEDNFLYRNMIVGDDGVIRKWIKAGARGWRLDVADELPDSFIQYIRKSVKEEGDDKLLLGEVWEDASNKISYDEKRQFLMGDELDSTMNYPLRQILLDYINYTISSGKAADKIMSLKENYPRENYYGALNVIGTHDRARILTAMAADQDYNSACCKVKIMAALQYTLPGVPCIYYGDEIGMQGGTDPENRNTFPWGKGNMDIAYTYRMLGLIYDEHPVLKDGEIQLLSGQYDAIPDDVLAFIRYDENEQILVLVNRSYANTRIDLSSFGIPESSYALELLESKEMNLSGAVDLERLSAKIILIKDESPIKEDNERKSGVICHISSLPGGTLGGPAREFVDWMESVGLKVWQVLPLNPPGIGNCPYNSYSAFAGNPDFINYDEIPEDMETFRSFIMDNKFWLDGYVEFVDDEQANELVKEQYYFYRQWNDLKEYANAHHVQIMGDLPIFVAADSADVRDNPDIFLTDKDGKLAVHAGVPADGFSSNGQNWGLALYDWEALRSQGYDWWIKRLKQCAERYDILRLDHFRGFSEYFAIPAGGTPADGNWEHGPGLDFFNMFKEELAKDGLELDILAEDLGLLDAGVLNLIKLTGYPGMDIWQFSAQEMMDMDPELAKRRAFYTGTHDNQTLVGWLKITDSYKNDREIDITALGIIKQIFNSPAKYAMLQLQDVLLLDDDCRMNVPGVAEGNWKWHIPECGMASAYHDRYYQMSQWLKQLIEDSNR